MTFSIPDRYDDTANNTKVARGEHASCNRLVEINLFGTQCEYNAIVKVRLNVIPRASYSALQRENDADIR